LVAVLDGLVTLSAITPVALCCLTLWRRRTRLQEHNKQMLKASSSAREGHPLRTLATNRTGHLRPPARFSVIKLPRVVEFYWGTVGLDWTDPECSSDVMGYRVVGIPRGAGWIWSDWVGLDWWQASKSGSRSESKSQE